MVLNEVGIHADVCTGGAEALRQLEVQHAKGTPYNLVLMDWNMPEMNGLEATAAPSYDAVLHTAHIPTKRIGMEHEQHKDLHSLF